MAKKPNFDFERRERVKDKALKRAEKAKAKADRKSSAGEAEAPEGAIVESASGDVEQ